MEWRKNLKARASGGLEFVVVGNQSDHFPHERGGGGGVIATDTVRRSSTILRGMNTVAEPKPKTPQAARNLADALASSTQPARVRLPSVGPGSKYVYPRDEHRPPASFERSLSQSAVYTSVGGMHKGAPHPLSGLLVRGMGSSGPLFLSSKQVLKPSVIVVHQVSSSSPEERLPSSGSEGIHGGKPRPTGPIAVSQQRTWQSPAEAVAAMRISMKTHIDATSRAPGGPTGTLQNPPSEVPLADEELQEEGKQEQEPPQPPGRSVRPRRTSPVWLNNRSPTKLLSPKKEESSSKQHVNSPGAKRSGWALGRTASGDEDETGGARRRGGKGMEKLKEPAPKTNALEKFGEFVMPTDEMWAKARKATSDHACTSNKEHEAAIALFKGRRGLDEDRRVFALIGGNKAVREALSKRGLQEVPEHDIDTNNFDFRWSLCHDDINFDQITPPQLVNHFPNSGSEVGAKVGLHRNLRSLSWLDGIDMYRFFPRMYTLANPGDMQDFVDDFIFVAAHTEIVRHVNGQEVTCPTSQGDAAAQRVILEHAYWVCEKFLDNKKKVDSFDPSAGVHGVLDIDDLFILRPDLLVKYKQQEKKDRKAARGAWANLEEDVVNGHIAAMHARLKAEHVQLQMDGIRNVWIVKPGYGSRGRGIKCFDDISQIISYATGRKKAAIVQKYVENCLCLEDKKFDIRCWVLVSNWNPLTVWTYEPYIRICTNKHSLDTNKLQNQYAHLCNRCVQQPGGKYVAYAEDDKDGSMWSVKAMQNYLDTCAPADCQGMGGKEIWDKIMSQVRQISVYSMHSVQETIDNKPGCFEWFGMDFMVDKQFNVWTLECNISPDLSTGTKVLDRLVPAAMSDMCDMFLNPQQKGQQRTDEHWELAFRGQSVARDVLQKRFWLKKALISELRAGRPYSMRDALQVKIGALTHQFLSARGAGSKKQAKGAAGKGGKKVKKAEDSDSEDDDEEDDE